MDSHSRVVSLAPGEQWSVPVASAMDTADGDQIVEIEIDCPVDNSEPITLVYPVTSDTLYGAVPSAESESHIVSGTPGNEAPTTTCLPDDPVISTMN